MRGMSLMLSQAALGLALDPGMGKTSTWLGAFTTLKQLGYVDKMLVVAPLKPMYNTWPREIDKFEEFHHLTWCFLHGPQKHAALNAEADIYLINPEGIQWLCETIDPSKLADVLCIDESTKFKSWMAKRMRALKPFIPRFQRRWIGTGNICPRALEDLFAPTYILDCGNSLGRGITKFREKWFSAPPWNPYDLTPLPGAEEEILDAIAPLYLQLNADDHIKLPSLQVTDIKVKLPPEVRRVYDEVEREFLATLPDTESLLLAPTEAAAGGKCRQLANGAVYVEEKANGMPRWEKVHDEKIFALRELLDEIGEDPTIIAYEYKHDKLRIAQHYPDAPDLTGMTGESLDYMINAWNEGRISKLLIQSSAAHGLNIQESGNKLIWFGIPWNWEDYKQMIDRLRRRGQKASMVQVYRILAEDTLDIEVANRLYEKQTREQGVKDGLARRRELDFA